MFIKRYSVAAFILMAVVGWYVYAYLTNDTMALNFFGYFELPPLSIALLVVIPTFLLYVASVLHMSFYNMLAKLKQRKSQKDYEKLFDSITDAYLGKKERKHTFKTAEFELFGKLLDNSVVFPNADIALDTNDERTKKLNAALQAIKDIQSGEVVELKSFALETDNPLYIQNQRNMYKKGNLKAEDILSHAQKYTKELCQEVYGDYVSSATVANIEKYKEFLTKETLLKILARINADENSLEMNNEAIVSLMKSLDLKHEDYMQISKVTAKSMNPDQRIKLFEILSAEEEEAVEAYLYTLFDLEMLDPAYALLEISQPDEYKKFKAYKALRENNQNFNIELFI